MSILYPIYIQLSRDTVDNFQPSSVVNKGRKRLRYATHSHPRPQSVAMYYIITPSVVRGLPTVANNKTFSPYCVGVYPYLFACVWGGGVVWADTYISLPPGLYPYSKILHLIQRLQKNCCTLSCVTPPRFLSPSTVLTNKKNFPAGQKVLNSRLWTRSTAKTQPFQQQ